MKIKVLKPIGTELFTKTIHSFDKDVMPVPRILEVATDGNGIPMEKFWRDRFMDAHHDQCICFLDIKITQSETPGEPDTQQEIEKPIHGNTCPCGPCERKRTRKAKVKQKEEALLIVKDIEVS